MNRIYNLVWNRTLKVLQVASELARSHSGAAGSGETARKPGARNRLFLACAAVLALGSGVLALPASAQTTGLLVGSGGAGDVSGSHPGGNGGIGGGGGGGVASGGGGGGGGFGGGGGGGATGMPGGVGGGPNGGSAGNTSNGGGGDTGGTIGGNGGAATAGSNAGSGISSITTDTSPYALSTSSTYDYVGVGGGGGGSSAASAGNGANGEVDVDSGVTLTVKSGLLVGGGGGGAGGVNTVGFGGSGGSGVLAVGGGAAVSVAGIFQVGGGGGGGGYYVGDAGNGGSGTVTATGGSATSVTGTLQIGGNGGGGGGNAANNNAHAGRGGNGTFTVDGSGLSVTGVLQVGGDGGGAGSGGLVTGGQGGAGGAGTLTVSDGSTVSVGQIVLGGSAGSGSPTGTPGGAGGAGVFNLGGDSTLTFTGTSPTFTINSNSVFNVGNATVNGTTGGSITGLTSITDNRTINFNQTDTSTISTDIIGTGSVNQNGNGRTILDGTNTYTGGTTINGGTLQIGNGGTTGSISGNVTDNGALVFDQSGNLTYGGAVSGTGSLTQQGTGALILAGSNTYSGGTTVSGGTLEIAAGGVPGTGTVTVDGSTDPSATLQVDSGASLTNHIVLSNGSTLDNAGTLNDTVDPYAVESDNSTATVTNHDGGTILGDQAGVALFNGGTVSNDGAGSSISASGAGGFQNGALIEGAPGTVDNTDGGSIFGAGNGIYFGNGGSVVNDGAGSTISASGLSSGGAAGGSDGVLVQAGSATVMNTHGATISGTTVGVGLLNGGTITNDAASTIEATGTLAGDCFATGDCSIFVASASDGQGFGGALTLSNAGTIIGNVQMDPTAANITTLTAGGSITGDLDIGSDAISTLTLNGDNTTPQLYSTAVTGTTTFAGALTKAGTGEWIVDSNDLSSVTSTTLSAGTLRVGDGGTTGSIGSGNVADNGSLVFDRSDAITYAGAISGSGALTQAGAGTLTLTGANIFTGGTTINAGTLQVGDGSTTGSIGNGNVADAGTLVFDRSDAVTYNGVISGSGALTQAGTGALALTGANTFTGGTTISAGTLQVGDGGTTGSIGTGNVADNGTLVFDRSDAVTYAGALSGSGALTQAGGGSLIMNGDGSAFTGTTAVQSGTLIVGDDGFASGSLGGAVDVAQGATLGGFGTVGSLDLLGTLSPGHSIGTLHVSGDAIFEKGSTFAVDAAPAGQADQLAVGGKATIKGGNTVVMAQPGAWAPETTYTIVTAQGGISGQFAAVSDNQAFLTPVLGYSADAVSLTLQRNSINFNAVAVTPNQKGVAAAANGLGFGNALYDAMVKLDAEDARVAFDQTSGEFDASQETARIDDSRYIREAMDQRLRQGDVDTEAEPIPGTKLMAWAHAWGHWGTTNSDGNAAKLADNGDGLLLGADLPMGTQGRIGVTGGASRNSLSVDARDSWGRETSTWLGAFAGYAAGAFGLRGGVAYAWDQVPSTREVNFPGYTDRLSGNASGNTLTGFIEGAWTFKFTQGSVAPFINLAHTRVETDASTEMGGAAALDASEGSANVSFGTLGARGEINVTHHLDVHGELGWQHAFGDTTPERDLQFVADGDAFTEYGVPVAKNAGMGRIGLGWHRGNVTVDADYEGLAGSGAKDQAAKLSLDIAL